MTDLRRIDLNLLVTLEAILEEQNLTRAAKRVDMTQPALSSALTRLRKVVGDELLVRAGRGFELTPVAAELLPRVRSAMTQVQRTLDVSHAFEPATSTRRFTISISDYALYVLGGPLERRLDRLAPGVQVDFDPIPPPDELGTHLLRRDVVIGGAGRGIPGQRRPIFRDHFVGIVSHADTPLTGDRPSVHDLRSLPYLGTWFGGDVRTPVDDALAAADLAVRRVQTAPGLLALPFLVAGTDLLAFVPHRLATEMAPQLGLRVLLPPFPVARLVEAAFWHPLSAEKTGTLWLLDVLSDVAGELSAATVLA